MIIVLVANNLLYTQMKRSKFFIYSIALLFATSVFAQTPLTKDEKKKALDHLNNTQKELLKAVKGLSEEQLNFKMTPESWSIAECVEHIAISENNIFGIVQMTLQNEPNPEGRADLQLADEQVLGIITNREQKVKTRKEFEPTNQFGSYEGSLNEFKNKRKSNISFVKSTSEDLRNRYFEFPFGKVDAFQVILFMSGHTQRHTDQIKEILAHENFPNA